MLISNFCGAHSVPKDSTAAQATEDIIQNQIPRIVELTQQGEISPSLIDVFCEKGVFTTEQSSQILAAGVKAGLFINFHGDELNDTKSAEMGASLGAVAISHLECISPEGIVAMQQRGVVATLLPTTAYVLRIEPPPARKLIDAGVPCALGTDFNPNAHCLSMPHAMNLACVMMRMTVNEALVAATINSAGKLWLREFLSLKLCN
jgi:imidazolonepropionase